MAIKRCPNCGAQLTSDSVDCVCGYSFITGSMPTLTYKPELALHNWQWFLCKEKRIEKRWELQSVLKKLAAIAAGEAGSEDPEVMYRRGCSIIKDVHMPGSRKINYRVHEAATSVPACTLFAILNQLEHIEHPTRSGNWEVSIDPGQFRNPRTHMFENYRLPEYFKLIEKLNSDWCYSVSFPQSYEDPTQYVYDEELAEFTLFGTDVSRVSYQNVRKIIISSGVGIIPDRLFRRLAHLKEVVISPGVFGIGDGAFAGCPELEVVHIPDSISEIGCSAFAGCVQLTTLKIQSNKTIQIGSHAFALCPVVQTCNQSVNAVLDRLSDIRAEIENEDISAIQDNTSKPFFTDDQALLIDGTANRNDDLKEAMRRMDLFFSTAPFLKKYANDKSIQGEWYPPRTYYHIFSTRTYYHYHDGEEVEQTAVAISRISAKKYYEGKIDAVSELNYGKDWMCDPSVMSYETERYYLDDRRFRAKNFLGMVGFFEVRFSID